MYLAVSLNNIMPVRGATLYRRVEVKKSRLKNVQNGGTGKRKNLRSQRSCASKQHLLSGASQAERHQGTKRYQVI